MSDIVEAVTVRLEAKHKEVLDHVQEKYPALSRSALFIQLMYEYYWNREQGNGKSARLERIENSVMSIQATQEQMNARMIAIEATLRDVLKERVLEK